MFKLINNIKIRNKLILLLSVFLLGFSSFAVFSYSVIQEVKVGGPVYSDIVQGKDLVADILPPPEYIIESYLTVLELSNETDRSKIDGLISKMKKLEKDYIDRHNYWVKNLPEGIMKKVMVEDSYNPAKEFFDVVNSEFIPVVLEGNQSEALLLANGKLKNSYEKHRESIDKVVIMANESNKSIETTSGRNIYNSIIILGLLALGTIVLSLLLSVLIITSIIKPIGLLKRELKDLAERGGDLTKQIAISSKDEMGELANIVNMFLGNLKQIIAQIIRESKKIGDVAKKVNNYMSSLNTNIHNVSEITEEISGGMEEVSASTQELNATTVEFESAIEMVAKKAQEGALSANEIKERSDRIKESVIQSQTHAQDVYFSTQEKLKRAIEQSKAVEQINLLTESILQITDQTNLLALNASIEAARAGENGKGFTVVAEEIRKLAEDSKNTVSKISQVTKTVIGSVESLAQQSGNLLEFVDKQVIDDYRLMVETVERYNKDALYYYDIASDLSATSEELMAAIEGMSRAINDITKSCNESAVGTNNIARKASDVFVEAGEVVKQSDEVDKTSGDLIDLVARFKV